MAKTFFLEWICSRLIPIINPLIATKNAKVGYISLCTECGSVRIGAIELKKLLGSNLKNEGMSFHTVVPKDKR